MQQGYLIQDLANWEIKGKGGNQNINFSRHRPKKKQILSLAVTDGQSKPTTALPGTAIWSLQEIRL